MERDSLTSDSVLVRVDLRLVEFLLDQDSAHILRPAPSVRGGVLAELGSAILIASTLGANVANLILAKDQIREFAGRLLSAMRRCDVNEVDISYKSADTKIQFTVKTSDRELDIQGLFRNVVQAMEEYRGDGIP